jgi:hypothetical protein
MSWFKRKPQVKSQSPSTSHWRSPLSDKLRKELIEKHRQEETLTRDNKSRSKNYD